MRWVRQCAANKRVNRGFQAVCAALLIVAISTAGARSDEPKPAAAPPVIEKITESVFRVGKATVDMADRTVTCTGVINQDHGAVEYLAVAPDGKTHESLLRINVRPLHLQIALLLLDLEPKNVLTRQGDPRTPQGAPVSITVRWRDSTGASHEARAEELLVRLPGNKPTPEHPWVFTGSRITKEGFEADLEKSLVAVWHDPAALLDNPMPGGGDNANIVNSAKAPPRDTPVEMVIRALSPPVSPK